MKYADKVDIFDDLGNCLAEDLPIESLSPLNNAYMVKFLDYFKRTCFIDLKKLELMINTGQVGYSTSLKHCDVQLTSFTRDWEIFANAEAIQEKVEKIIKNSEDDDSEIKLLRGNDILIVKIPSKRLMQSASRLVTYSSTGVALMQALSDIFDINPLTDPDGCALLKTAVFGKYPLTKNGFQPGNPVFGLLREPQSEIPGFGYKNTLFNNIVGLAHKRTFDAVIFSSILEQASQFEIGNAIGWFERYHLLGLAYQGLNADRVVYDLINENQAGTVGDVVTSLMKIGMEDGLIKRHGRAYPSKLFSDFQFFKSDDFAKWNAYTCAGLLAASIVNCGASRAAQSVSGVFAGFSDLLMFESGGLPDPDCGRIMGAGLGLNLYTHSILGDEGDIGSYAMDSEFLRHSSFMSPCIAAAICLDSGTQLKRPETTSEVFIRLKESEPFFDNPLKQICEAAQKGK